MDRYVAVCKHRMNPALPRKDAKPCYQRVELLEALNRTWATDAHLVMYVCPTPDGKQHRLSKSHAHEYPYPPTVSVLFADIDNPGHAPWTDALMDAAHLKWQKVPTAGIYTTAHGYRLVQPLVEAVPYTEEEDYIKGWWFELLKVGILFDESCRDWTRHYRLPHVTRNGRAFRSTLVNI